MRIRSLGCLGFCACALVNDLDRFHPADAGSTATNADAGGETPLTYRTLPFVLKGFKVHASHYLEYRVVNDSNVVQMVGGVDPLAAAPDSDYVLTIENAIPTQGDCRLDFYADVNKTRSFDGVVAFDVKSPDAWRLAPLNRPPPALGRVDGAVVEISFTHDLNFTDIDKPAPPVKGGATRRVSFVGMGEYVKKRFDIRFLHRRSKHVVGAYRIPSITAAAFDVAMEGVLEANEDYDIDIHVDVNGNRKYDRPTDGDVSWRISQTALPSGVAISFDPAQYKDSIFDIQLPE